MDREKLFERACFKVVSSHLFLYWNLFGFCYSGVGQQFEYSTPFAPAGFWLFFATDFKNQTKVCIASRLVSTAQIEV